MSFTKKYRPYTKSITRQSFMKARRFILHPFFGIANRDSSKCRALVVSQTHMVGGTRMETSGLPKMCKNMSIEWIEGKLCAIFVRVIFLMFLQVPS
jgi:hypothetical protein